MEQIRKSTAEQILVWLFLIVTAAFTARLLYSVISDFWLIILALTR